MTKTIALFLHHPTCSTDSVNGVIAALSPMANIKLFTRHKVSEGFFDDVDLVVFPGGDGEATTFRSILKFFRIVEIFNRCKIEGIIRNIRFNSCITKKMNL